MSENYRVIDLPTVGAVPLMQIAPANAGCSYFEKNVLFSDLWNGNFS
jgi:hypothetical protein